ncbi:CAZyme family GT2 [Penicillium roqueforti]|nr:CAZyme family GT2 [Penicillium roqueforti]KAI3105387.1 CAZyme family GT2 [Penicillium roqueforti]
MFPNNVYEIEELSPDDRALYAQKYRKYLRRIAQAAIWTTYIYFTVRLFFTVMSPEQTWQRWLMLGVEGLFAHISLNHQRLSLAATTKPPHQTLRKRLRSNENLPRVDVLVTCCGEPVEIILDTVRAACGLDYPASRFRVRLLDDGASTDLHDAIAKLATKWTHLSYHTRGKQSGQSFAKAGNLNYALFSLQTEDPPEFCTVVDADSILMPEFLRATLPHLLEDPKAALLTTRQYFYNLPCGDPLSQSRAYFYTCENTELDLLGHALDAGSGAVFRRDAILDAGGYPTYSFSEDWQLSLILRGLGKRTMQVQEVLQFGLVPTSLAGHLKQRNRWHIGHSQQISVLLPSVNKAIPEHLRWDIALGGLSIMAGLVTYSIGFVALPFLLVSDGGFIPAGSALEVKIQLVLAIVHVASTWAYDWARSAHAGVPFAPFAHAENSWLSTAHLYAIARFHLFGSKPKGSFVTGSTANSSENATSISSFQKAYRDTLQSGALLNICLFIATVGAMLFAIWVAVTGDGTEIPKLLTTFAWPPLLHLCFLTIFHNWVPIAHLFNSPAYHPRDSRLLTTEKEISYPRAEIEEELSSETPLLGLCCSFIVPVVLLGALAGVLIS